ncbi:Sensor histidine kinase RcsC [Candidatus Magnetaquicoccaceae bacterium FCR-1]|uniref:histidine kinase n=1 Tax=Candidatus Magnetaquiglobus chichijimensis TaxID=3141448 RepID=A0ABQ0CAD8_9PROT
MTRDDQASQLERLRKEIEVQHAINAFLKHSLAATHADQLLKEVLELFPHLTFLGAQDKGAVFLMDEQKQALVLVAHRNLADELLTQCAVVPLGHCLCGQAALTGQIQFASEVDERHEIRFSGMHPHGHFNVPILVDGKVAGVIVLYLRHRAPMDPECVQFLETASTIVAGALKRLKTEQQVRISEEMKRMVIENTPCGIITVNQNGAIRIFNSAAEQLFGYDKEEIRGKSIIDLVPLPLQNSSKNIMQCCIDTHHVHILRMPFEAEGMRRDGSVFPVRLAINRIHGLEDCFFIAIIIDMTHEKRLLEEMVHLEKTIIEYAPFGIVVTDNDEHILTFNLEAENLFGYSRNEAIGQKASALIAQGMRHFYSQGIRSPFSSEKRGMKAFESEAIRKDGSFFPIRLAVNRIVLRGKPAFLGMIADISEEKRLYAELVQSEKMAGLGSMVAGVAHEINTPVGIGVTAASELEERTRAFNALLRNEGISEEELEGYIASTSRLAGLIRFNLERAADLVRSFKSVAVDQSSDKLRTFKLRAYVESSVLTLHHELRHTQLLVAVVCPDDLEIRSHPGAFSQIILNLINNSRIHAFDPDQAGQITMEFQVEGDRLIFIYRDNGKGMTEEVSNRIFEPFFTTRRDLGGSGLGMHIVYNLATQSLGGTISCQSAPGCGITIQMEIPLLR